MSVTDFAWGPEIKVDGVQPEWLTGRVVCDILTEVGWRNDARIGLLPAEQWLWKYDHGDPCILAIRLPANHPHYTTPTPDERAVAPELVERMRKLVEAMAGNSGTGQPFGANNIKWDSRHYEEARAIVAALEPVETEYQRAKKELNKIWHEGFESVVEFAAAQVARGRLIERDSVTGVALGTREQFEKECG